ncbi:hypothetical protein MRX96_035337 [Rhipicephalus microplus]
MADGRAPTEGKAAPAEVCPTVRRWGGITMTPGQAFDMAAVLQATLQAAMREAIYGIAHLQSQETAAMPVFGAGKTSRLLSVLGSPTLFDSPTIDA